MLIPLAADVGDALATKKGKVAYYAAAHGTEGEVAPRLMILLTVKDIGPQRFRIEVCGDGWQSFEWNWNGH